MTQPVRVLLIAILASATGACGSGVGKSGEGGAGAANSAGHGGSAGGTGGAGGSAAGRGGSSGAAGAAVDCESLANATPLDPAARRTVHGTNGEFADQCDATGNLLEYWCETVPDQCTPPPNPFCTMKRSGKVVSTTIDCGGECADGICAVRCVDWGDQMTVEDVAADGDILVDHLSHARRYQCALTFDNPNDTIDCATIRRAGETLTIESLGITDSNCTAGRFNFGVGPCSYSCVRVPR